MVYSNGLYCPGLAVRSLSASALPKVRLLVEALKAGLAACPEYC